jgi:hypothetical protein
MRARLAGLFWTSYNASAHSSGHFTRRHHHKPSLLALSARPRYEPRSRPAQARNGASQRVTGTRCLCLPLRVHQLGRIFSHLYAMCHLSRLCGDLVVTFIVYAGAINLGGKNSCGDNKEAMSASHARIAATVGWRSASASTPHTASSEEDLGTDLPCPNKMPR